MAAPAVSRVLCCVTAPHPAAMAALEAHAPHAEVTGVTGGDEPTGARSAPGGPARPT